MKVFVPKYGKRRKGIQWGRHKGSPILFAVKNITILLSLFLTMLSMSGCLSARVKEADSTAFLMDTIVTQQWYGDKAEEACKAIEDALSQLEQEISIYIEDSEVSRINAAAGQEYVQVSDTVYELISRAKELSAESGGIYDITIAPLVLEWDITGEDPHVPSDAQIAEALEKVDYTKVLLDPETSSVMLEEEDMKLDLGGCAKGLAAGLMKPIVEEYGVSGFLSIGGNMLVVGTKPDGSDVVVGLRDPNGSETDYFATIVMDGYTMATSSASERYFIQDGVKYHHILDPFTGYPSDSDLISVTVLSEDGLLADTLSTTIFLKGSDCLSEYLNRSDCMVLVITADNEVYASEGVWERLKPVDEETYTFHSELDIDA